MSHRLEENAGLSRQINAETSGGREYGSSRARPARPAWNRFTGLLMAGGLAIGGLLCGGCDDERAFADTLAPRVDDRAAGASALVDDLQLDDLPGSLNLTAEQQEKMRSALAGLRSARQERREERREFRDGERRGRGRDGLKGRDRWDGRPDRNDGERRRGGRASRGLEGPGPGAAGPRPLMEFLERSSDILDTRQFTTLAGFLVERREAQIDQLRENRPARAGEFKIPRRVARHMDLTDDEQERLGELYAAQARQGTEIWRALESGGITPDEALRRVREARTEFEAQARGILGQERWEKAQALQERQRVARRDRAPERMDRLASQAERIGPRIEFLERVLHLDASQREQVASIQRETEPARRRVFEQAREGAVEPEEVPILMYQVEQDATRQVRSILNEDQARRFDALQALLPGGLRFGPMGAGGGFGAHRGRTSR